MKFKKQILSEEIGLPKSNRKTYTQNKKQKVVISEEQLRRLISKINEATAPVKRPADMVKAKPKPSAPAKPKPKSRPKPPSKPRPEPAKPKFNVNTWAPTFTKRIDNFIRNKNFKGALSFLKGRLATWQKKGSTAGPVWTQQLKQKSAVATKEKARVEREMKKKKPTPPKPSRPKPRPKPRPTAPTKPKQTAPVKPKQTAPAKPKTLTELSQKCCDCGDRVMVGQTRCPKSCKEVPCGGRGNGVTAPVFSERRTLKTTNPINESDIKDMKIWFNRINKAGNKYNPGII